MKPHERIVQLVLAQCDKSEITKEGIAKAEKQVEEELREITKKAFFTGFDRCRANASSDFDNWYTKQKEQ